MADFKILKWAVFINSAYVYNIFRPSHEQIVGSNGLYFKKLFCQSSSSTVGDFEKLSNRIEYSRPASQKDLVDLEK